MALTVTPSSSTLPGETGLGSSTTVVYAVIQGDSSYPSGGYAITPSQVNFSTQIVAVISQSAARGGYFLAWDNTYNTLRWFNDPASTGAFVEVAAGQSLSQYTFNCEILGW